MKLKKVKISNHMILKVYGPEYGNCNWASKVFEEKDITYYLKLINEFKILRKKRHLKDLTELRFHDCIDFIEDAIEDTLGLDKFDEDNIHYIQPTDIPELGDLRMECDTLIIDNTCISFTAWNKWDSSHKYSTEYVNEGELQEMLKYLKSGSWGKGKKQVKV